MHSLGSRRGRATRIAARVTRVAAFVALVALTLTAASCRQVFGREYEYEEDVTLKVTGAATINVNASLAALVALREIGRAHV